MHAQITRTALPDATPVTPPSQADLDAFRLLFWKTASANAEFARRFPQPFSAWEFKEFLMLDPAARVHGFDLIAGDEILKTRGDVLTAASRWPDDDERNRHRYLRDARHQVVKAADGAPTPYDPATLDFGSLTGTTSQGHAHYGLVDGPLSDDPEVLKKDPARFAVPPTAHAYGYEFFQLYTALSKLAAGNGQPWLAAAFAGNAFHHLEDVCNQIHTVQVGIYQFFESAFLQSKLQDVKTLGGLLGPRYSLKQIGLRLIANHHLLSEDLFARHFRIRDQPEAALDFKGIVAQSSQEAPRVYRLAWQFSARTLHRMDGHEYDGTKDDPDAYVRSDQQAAVEEFYRLEERGVVRAVAALRAWKPQGEVPVEALLQYHAAAAARRAAYRPAAAEHLGIAWGYPVAALCITGAVVALIASRLSKRS